MLPAGTPANMPPSSLREAAVGTKMTFAARAELTNVVRRRYRGAAGAEKRRILDEFIAVTGYHNKSAIRALNAEPVVRRRQTRARPSLYDEAARAALIVMWGGPQLGNPAAGDS